MKKSLLIFLLFSVNTLFTQEIVEYYNNGNLRMKGSINNSGLKDGLWFELDSVTRDTTLLLNYRNGIKEGRFIYRYQGTNMKSTTIASNSNNYSDWKDETFVIYGYFKNDEYHGEFEEYYDNGQLYLNCFYKNGKKIGKETKYHDNGKISFIKHYQNSIINGLWKQFYNTGKLREERLYKMDTLISSKTLVWYDNGKQMNEASYKHFNNEKISHGKFINLYENGNIQTISIYENGKPNGEWKSYYPSGEIKYIMLYVNFKYISYTEFDKDGNVKN